MTFAELKNLEADVATDDEGRLSSLKGEMTIEITDRHDAKHAFTVTFDCKAEAYGATSVPETFDPATYDLISYEEYNRRVLQEMEVDEYDYEDYWANIIKNDPGTVSFGGKIYETMMDLYADTGD